MDIKKYKIACFFILISGFSSYVNSQEIDVTRKNYLISQKTKGWFEGYQTSTGANDFLYHSIRDDVTESLLTRATTGKMDIEWLTEKVPLDWNADDAGFLWIGAMDYGSVKKKFYFYVNDELKFIIPGEMEEEWDVQSNDGGILHFSVISYDQHGDPHGYMQLKAPAAWITPGEALKLRVCGESANSNVWYMTFKAADVLDYLNRLSEYELWFDLVFENIEDNCTVLINAPNHLAGKKINYQIGNKSGGFELVERDLYASGSFILDSKIDELKNTTFLLTSGVEKILFVRSLFESEKTSILKKKGILSLELFDLEKDKKRLKVRSVYNPRLTTNLKKISLVGAETGKYILMNSSHQDIAWMDSPEKCVIERDTMLIAPLLEQAKTRDNYFFDLEDVLMIKEFISRHPARKEEINKLLKSGKLSCGSSFIQPYEEMYSGEALVRQFYFGTKWLSKEFDAYKADTYWNVDVPGRTLQMPQILRKAGTDKMVISRHEKSVFNWYSPDGSYVTAYSPGHYAEAYSFLHKDFLKAADYLAVNNLFWNKYNAKNPVIPVLSDWDMSPAEDYSEIIDNWHNLDYYEDEEGAQHNINLPKIELGTASSFIESFRKSGAEIPSITGERPAVWLYIHGPSHQKALKASREGDIYLTSAEKFASINSILKGSFSDYPTDKLKKAWEAKIFPDHGWGGVHGDITDNLFLKKFEFARSEALSVIESSINSIASRIKTNNNIGIPVVVFNSLSWLRNDPVSFKINLEGKKIKELVIIDQKKNVLPTQLTDLTRNEKGFISTATVHFIANAIPSLGYKTFYIKEGEFTEQKPVKSTPASMENQFYRINFASGGLKQIFDKELKKDLINSEKFLAGEVFTMRSEGNGAGEFSDIQQPTMEGFDKTGNYNAVWKLLDHGPVFDSYVFKQKIRNAEIEEKVIVYHSIKKIVFEIKLLNWEGILYREYRMALPLKMNDSQISYEVPFGIIEVGKDEIEGAAGERYTAECSQMRPRGIANWIGAESGDFGLSLSSSVAVADYIDPTDKPVKYPILQPVLLASRKSCNQAGNDYLQTGNHQFSFSFTSGNKGSDRLWRSGLEANEKLYVVVDPEPLKNTVLKEENSFFSLDKNNLIISAIKKNEENNSLVIRLYDISGKKSEIKLKTFFTVNLVSKTNIIEEKPVNILFNKNYIELSVGGYSIETFDIIPEFYNKYEF